MSAARAWHRWLAVAGERRQVVRWLTGWATFIFFGILCSGFCLWFPRIWSWRHIRPVVFFSGALRGRARDFNWHNTIGAWSVVPLIVVVASALPMSFIWANALYRVTGDQPPRPAGERNGGRGTIGCSRRRLTVRRASAPSQVSRSSALSRCAGTATSPVS
jgi:uncharacterized iron-regulated membrane protein